MKDMISRFSFSSFFSISHSNSTIWIFIIKREIIFNWLAFHLHLIHENKRRQIFFSQLSAVPATLISI